MPCSGRVLHTLNVRLSADELGWHRSCSAEAIGMIRRSSTPTWIGAWGRPPSVIGYAAQLTAILGYSTLPGLWAISAPALVLSGDDDPIIPTANPKLLALAIRNARLALVPGAGHMLPFEQAVMVGDFLDQP